MKKILVGIILLLTVISCNKKQQNNEMENLNTMTVKTGDIVVKLEESGEIQPIKEIKIKSKMSGKVMKFNFDEGDYINEGDIIAEIEPDFSQANQIANTKDNLKIAEIRLDNARDEFEDKTELYKSNYISKKELRNAETELKQAEISYRSALQQFELIKEIDTEGNISKLVSPASGTMIQKHIEEGEMVVASSGSYSEGTIICTIADLKQMIVKTSINEVDISKIEKNQTTKIQVDAYPYSEFTGTITNIAAMAVQENNVKVFPIEIKINESDERLKPGMTANITIIGEEKIGIVVVPIRAIFSNSMGNDIVYHVENDSLITEKVIKTGINDFQRVEIIEGINENDVISLDPPKNDTSKKQ